MRLSNETCRHIVLLPKRTENAPENARVNLHFKYLSKDSPQISQFLILCPFFTLTITWRGSNPSSNALAYYDKRVTIPSRSFIRLFLLFDVFHLNWWKVSIKSWQWSYFILKSNQLAFKFYLNRKRDVRIVNFSKEFLIICSALCLVSFDVLKSINKIMNGTQFLAVSVAQTGN
jgi:hypothetical protein